MEFISNVFPFLISDEFQSLTNEFNPGSDAKIQVGRLSSIAFVHV